MADFWETLKKDLNKAWDEGMAAVKDGTRFAARKVDQLTQEGKKLYKVYDLKTEVHREMGELGGLVHSLQGEVENPYTDKRVTAILKKIDALKGRIAKLEASERKAAKKKKTAKKATKKKTSAAK